MTGRGRFALLAGMLLATAALPATAAEALTTSTTVTTSAGRSCTFTATETTGSWSNPLDELVTYGGGVSCTGSSLTEADALSCINYSPQSTKPATCDLMPNGYSCTTNHCPQNDYYTGLGAPECGVTNTSNSCVSQAQFVTRASWPYSYWLNDEESVGLPGSETWNSPNGTSTWGSPSSGWYCNIGWTYYDHGFAGAQALDCQYNSVFQSSVL